MQTLIKYVEKKFIYHHIWPTFSSGDTIKIFSEIREVEGEVEREGEGEGEAEGGGEGEGEGTKTRVQYFKGVVIQCRGKGNSETFTVRKISDGVGIERIFFVSQPNIKKIEVYKYGKVRQARIYYFSFLKGKKARIKDKIK